MLVAFLINCLTKLCKGGCELDFDFQVMPVEHYYAPSVPRYGEADKAVLLKKLPSRWQKSAKLIAGLSLVGVLALSGCGSSYPRYSRPNHIEHDFTFAQGFYSGISEEGLSVRLHVGGGGGSGYVVFLTEQEAFGIIRARLEVAGLNFGATPPDYAVNVQGWDEFYEIGLDLFDEEKGVAIAHIDWQGERRAWRESERELARRAEREFEEMANDIVVGAFHNSGRHYFGGDAIGRARRPSRSAREEMRPHLRDRAIEQADIFIARLQIEGILESFEGVNIELNGQPLSFEGHTLFINNHIAVPANELFYALGMYMTPREHDDFLRWSITTEVGNVSMVVFEDWASIRVDDEWVPHEDAHPVFTIDGTTYISLQLIAEIIGASVEWDEDTRTMTINRS